MSTQFLFPQTPSSQLDLQTHILSPQFSTSQFLQEDTPLTLTHLQAEDPSRKQEQQNQQHKQEDYTLRRSAATVGGEGWRRRGRGRSSAQVREWEWGDGFDEEAAKKGFVGFVLSAFGYWRNVRHCWSYGSGYVEFWFPLKLQLLAVALMLSK